MKKGAGFLAECLEVQTYVRKAAYIAGTFTNVAKVTGLSLATVSRLSSGLYRGSRATRMRLQTYVEKNEAKGRGAGKLV